MAVQLYASLSSARSVASTDAKPRPPLEQLTADDHLHRLLVLRIGGRRVPSMGYFGIDDVCLDTWLPELLDARAALLDGDATYVFDEGEQGQPAFHFTRRGDRVALAIRPSAMVGRPSDEVWDSFECDHASFEEAVATFATRVRAELRAAAPATAEAWWAARVGTRHVAEGPVTKPVLVLDGSRFADVAGFTEEVSEQIFPGHRWGGNLDALNDMLAGGFGTPDRSFVLEWRNASRARIVLGKHHTAGRTEGPTLFDEVVAIVRDHGNDGPEAEVGIDLRLIE